MKLAVIALTLLLPIVVLAEPVKYADSSTIESNAFGEPREIMISLPESYAKSASSVYPVIYTVRGQLDLLAVMAAINMLDSEAPEFIVVGISGSGSEFFPSETNNKASSLNYYIMKWYLILKRSIEQRPTAY